MLDRKRIDRAIFSSRIVFLLAFVNFIIFAGIFINSVLTSSNTVPITLLNTGLTLTVLLSAFNQLHVSKLARLVYDAQRLRQAPSTSENKMHVRAATRAPSG